MSMDSVDLHAASSYDSLHDELGWSDGQHSRAVSGIDPENPGSKEITERTRFRPFVSEAKVCALCLGVLASRPFPVTPQRGRTTERDS